MDPESVIAGEAARALAELSAEIGRQIGLLITRAGVVKQVVLGDNRGLMLPDLYRQRGSSLRLRGLRLVHTHLADEPLTDDDLADLALLRLDLIAALSVTEDGLPGRIRVAHLAPSGGGQKVGGSGIELLEANHPSQLQVNCLALIQALEDEFARSQGGRRVDDGRDRALLISVSSRPRWQIEESLVELADLAESAGVEVLDSISQRVKRVHPNSLMGRGKLTQVAIQALQLGANLLVFDRDLSPTQSRNLLRLTELRVLDRTQLILDIFAQRARSREGKLQVEMAQLRYSLPHLAERDNALSRLTGGIGARGPGETRLEVDRRRVRDRLARLGRDLKKVGRQRRHRRAKRGRAGLPVVSIVGYTNAGKSTLLNTLTQSKVVAEDRLFATLDPTTRRLRLPRDQEIIITDTVGFIRHLPAPLKEAFRATLEELEEADLLIHLVDASTPGEEERMEVVTELMDDLGLGEVPTLVVFNKADRASTERLAALEERHNALAVSALKRSSLLPMVEALQRELIGLGLMNPPEWELELEDYPQVDGDSENEVPADPDEPAADENPDPTPPTQ